MLSLSVDGKPLQLHHIACKSQQLFISLKMMLCNIEIKWYMV